jgi:hypothetical protein
MFAQFRYLDGARAEEIRVVGSDFATIGRHPHSEIGFDPEVVEVSVRHAAVFKQGGRFLIRDLGSTNGTFVNDSRVRGDRPLEPNDVIRLGLQGPRIAFSTTATMPIGSNARPQPPPVASTEIYRPRARTTAPVPAVPAPRVPPRTAWRPIVAAVVIVAIGGGWHLASTRATRRATDRLRGELLARVDRHLGQLAALAPPSEGVVAALSAAAVEARAVRTAIEGAKARSGLDSLDQALRAVARRQETLLRTAAFEPAAATAEARGSLALVIGEVRGAAARVGTGFVARRVGDRIWVVTARSAVFDSSGGMPVRVAVVLAASGAAHLATIAGRDSADLVVLALRGVAARPPPVRLAGTVAAGEPVAALGLPSRLDSLGDWRRTGIPARVAIGTLASADSLRAVVDGYRSAAAPGSPLLNPAGEAVGVIVEAAAGRWVAAPAGRMRKLLDQSAEEEPAR